MGPSLPEGGLFPAVAQGARHLHFQGQVGVPSPEGVQGRAAGAGVAAAELSIPPSAGDTAGEMRGVSGAPEAHSS